MRKQELHPRTALLNKKQKNKSKLARNAALQWLATQFPEAFNNDLRIRPLKTGIMQDILTHSQAAQDAGISIAKLREAVVLFTRRIDYLTVLKSREMRIDLQGQPTCEVTEIEAENAAQKIKKRIEKNAKNAKKMQPQKTVPTLARRDMNATHFYPERAPAFSTQHTSPATARPTPIVIKQKPRQFDPSAVARLKEKLGLSREQKPLEKVSE